MGKGYEEMKKEEEKWCEKSSLKLASHNNGGKQLVGEMRTNRAKRLEDKSDSMVPQDRQRMAKVQLRVVEKLRASFFLDCVSIVMAA